MKRLSKKLVAVGAVLGSVLPAFAATTGSSSSITMPTPDYTTFFAAVGVVAGVSLTVALAKNVISFFKKS